MQFTAAAVLSTLALAGSALAQSVNGPSFNLVLTSQDPKYNGSYLSTCHEGAGIESLCASNRSEVFYQNTTENVPSAVKYDSDPGPLYWYLPATPQGVYQSLGFIFQYSSNTLQAAFGYGMKASVSFDTTGLMNIQTTYDDSVSPPSIESPHSLYNWFICTTNFAAYQYPTLSFALGNGTQTPTNPSCVAVGVKKVDIPAP